MTCACNAPIEIRSCRREALDEEKSPPIRRINCEQVTLIWLDPQIGQKSAFSSDLRQTEQILRELNDYVLLFSNSSDCFTHIESIRHETVVLIVAGSSASPDLLTRLHKLRQLDSIFIFCRHKSVYQSLLTMREYHKLVDAIDEQTTLEVSIARTIEQIAKQSIIFALYDPNKQWSTRDLDRNSGSFLFLQLVKQVIRKMLPNEDSIHRSKEEMLEKCRVYYRRNKKETENIARFEKDYISGQSIEWYTYDSFMYKLINQALRTEDINALYTYRFYINDLCACLAKNCQLLREHASDITVYRGQRMSKAEILRLRSSVTQLIAVNGYLSTSRRQKVAGMFAGIGTPVTTWSSSDRRESVIFDITVDLDKYSGIIVADVRHLSKHRDEEEVLFDLGTAFKITAMEYDDELGYWKCSMSASDEGSAIVQEYLQFRQKEVDNVDDVEVAFGTLLHEMGEWQKSRNHFQNLLRHRPDDPHVYFAIGRTCLFFSELDQAVTYFERAYHFTSQKEENNEAFTAKIHCNMLRVYQDAGNFKKALAFGEEALKIYQRLNHPNNIADTAHLLMSIGLVYFNQGHDQTSSEYLQRAFALLQSIYPFDHPETSLCLNHMSFAHYRQGDYDKALDYLQRSLQTDYRLLPLDHPSISAKKNNIGKQYYKQGKYQQALKQFLQAADINIRAGTDCNKGYIVELNNLGKISYRLNNIEEAVAYYDKALSLIEGIYSISSDHIYLAYTWKNQGEILFMSDDFLDALKLFEHAHDAYVRIFGQDENHRDIAKCKHLRALVHLALGDLVKAEDLFTQAVSMWIEVLPPHHPDLAYAHRSISHFHKYKRYGKANDITPSHAASQIYEKRPPFPS